MKNWILPLNLCFSMIGLGQIWLVQLSSYPLWAHVGAHEFHDYHLAWWHSIWGPIFVPAGLAILCTVELCWFRPPVVSRSSVWGAIVLLLVVYGLTYLWWAPLMALIGSTPEESRRVFSWAPLLDHLGLRNKPEAQLYDLLIATHWLRVALLTAYSLLIFWMTQVAAGSKKVFGRAA